MDATQPNVVPMVPGERGSKEPETTHYQDRKTKEPLCGAEWGESKPARSWKQVDCEACEAAKRPPGRPETKPHDAPKTTEKKTAPDTAIEPALPLAETITLAVDSLVILPVCKQLRKARPDPEHVKAIGPATVAVLQHYELQDHANHPLVQLVAVLALVSYSIYASPTIESDDELSLALRLPKDGA